MFPEPIVHHAYCPRLNILGITRRCMETALDVLIAIYSLFFFSIWSSKKLCDSIMTFFYTFIIRFSCCKSPLLHRKIRKLYIFQYNIWGDNVFLKIFKDDKIRLLKISGRFSPVIWYSLHLIYPSISPSLSWDHSLFFLL